MLSGRRALEHALFACVVALVGCSASTPDSDGSASDASVSTLTDGASVIADVSDTPYDTGTPVTPDDAAGISTDGGGGSTDAADANACTVSGVTGECLTVAACTALGSHSSTPGHCPGSSTIECCTKTPSVADNPPIPAGYKLMMQSQVTPDMTTWAVAILHDPTTYPMFSTTTKTFGTLNVLARVEWHPPDFQNGVIHRGVTLYVPV